MSQKLCTGPCGRKLELIPENFRRDRTKASGFKSRCRQCLRKYNATKWPSVAKFDKTWASKPLMKPPVAKLDPEQESLTPVEPLPERHYVWGVSTQVNKQGDVISQWVKTKVEEEDRYAMMLDAIKHIADDWPKKAAAVKSPKYSNDDLLACYPMGDPHLGMLAWPAETGNKFDLEIAEANLYSAADKLVSLAPNAKNALVVNLGDFFHSDNQKGETTRGTKVDVDGRWPKVLQAGVRVMRRIIDRALEKHEHVTVVNEIGNHDAHSAIMLSICLAQFYENEPRVTVDTSPEPFHYYRFGKVFIGITHGDKTKKIDLGPIMATDRPKDWGETKHRYWLIGHVHHDTLKELHGVTVESFRTLAGKDAWHHASGYRAGRDMKVDIYHKEFGRINRHIIGIDQLVTE